MSSTPIAIVPPRVSFIDPKTGDISRPWFLLICAIVERIGGPNGFSAEDLAIGTPVGMGVPEILSTVHALTSDAALFFPPPTLPYVPEDPFTPPLVDYRPEDIAIPAPVPHYGEEIGFGVIPSLGSIAEQMADRVRITGGTINNTTIGLITAVAAKFTTVDASGQITSTVATGTPPLVVASTTQVVNLNASQLIGKTWAAPNPIGATTPSSGEFTFVTTTGNLAVGATLFTGTGLAHSGTLGFYSAAGVAKPTITGSRGGNVALASLLTGLASMGLVTNSTVV